MSAEIRSRKRAGPTASLLLLLVSLVSQTSLRPASYPHLRKLYRTKRYFELRDQLKSYDSRESPELRFFRGAVDNIFNRLPSSIAHLTAYLENRDGSRTEDWSQEAYDLLADSYRKSFRYAEAADVYEKILLRFGNALSDRERADHRNEFRLWNALREVPVQTVEFSGDTRLRMEMSRIPITINGHPVALSYDTGADLSVIIRSLADDFGLERVKVPVKVGTITGEKIDAEVGVAGEIRLGNATVRHALFLILRDDDFYIPEIDHQIQGVLGFPVLAALREVTITRAGEILIPQVPRAEGEQNLALAGLKPVIEGSYKGERLAFVLDTGANKSDLWPPFLSSFEKDITGRSELQTEKFRGAGSRREVRAYIAEDLTLKLSGKEVVFRRIPVFAEYTTENSRYFYGNLGQDLLRQFESITINFENMCVVFLVSPPGRGEVSGGGPE